MNNQKKINARRMNVRVPSDPADISQTGIPVIGMDIEDVFMGQGCAEQVASRRMHDTFRLARGTRRLQRVQNRAESMYKQISHIEDKQRILR